MFLPVEFEIADKIKYDAPNLLSVVIDPAPYEQPQIGYTSQVYTQKTRMNYWWDFCPRIIHLGIWEVSFCAFYRSSSDRKILICAHSFRRTGRAPGFQRRFVWILPARIGLC